MREGNVEAEFALVDEFEHGVGEDGFAERADVEERGDRYGAGGIFDCFTEAMEPYGFAVSNDGNGDAGDLCCRHPLGDALFELRDRRVCGCDLRGRLCGHGERQSEQKGDRDFHG